MKTPITRTTRSTNRANTTPKTPVKQKPGICCPMKSMKPQRTMKRVRFQGDDEWNSLPSTPKKNRIQTLAEASLRSVPKAPRINSRIKPYNPIVFIEEDPVVQDLLDENEELRWMVYDLQQNKAKAEENGRAALIILTVIGLVWSYY